MQDRFASSVWNFLWWTENVLLADATRARSEEGRLFSQANLWNTTPWSRIQESKSITKHESLGELKRALEALRLWLYSHSIWRCPKLTFLFRCGDGPFNITGRSFLRTKNEHASKVLEDRAQEKLKTEMDALHVMLSCHHFSKVMVNFCSVANCLNSSRNRPDLPFLLTLPNRILESFGRSFEGEVIPNSESKKPFGFAASSIN